MKLALGTAQFGLNYGIANESGIVSSTEIIDILAKARLCGIDTIDTAVSYGSSEALLGEAGLNNFRVISKLPQVPPGTKDVSGWVTLTISQSLDRLGLEKLYALHLHRPEDLFSEFGSDLLKVLNRLKQSGVVEKLGTSIYGPEILYDLTNVIDLDLVQAPLNLLDRRILISGWLDKLHRNDVEVHCRSPFLQGLLLMPRKKIPRQFEKWASTWDFWDESTHGNLDVKIERCLNFVSSIESISRIIVGVQACNQLDGLLVALNSKQKLPDLTSLITNDQDLIDPSRWVEL